MFGFLIISTKKLRKLIKENISKDKEILQYRERYADLYDRYNYLQFLNNSYGLQLKWQEDYYNHIQRYF